MSELDILLEKKFGFLGLPLLEALAQHGQLVQADSGTTLIKAGQMVHAIPLVIEGLIKVFTPFEDKELLLYYIQPGDSCVMSLTAGLNNEPSKIVAVTEKETQALLVNMQLIQQWMGTHPRLHTLFYQQYNLRYADLLDTIHALLFNRLDKRLLDYLREKSQLTGQPSLAITHKQMAAELGTSREVITRLLKKLEQEGFVLQSEQGVTLL